MAGEGASDELDDEIMLVESLEADDCDLPEGGSFAVSGGTDEDVTGSRPLERKFAKHSVDSGGLTVRQDGDGVEGVMRLMDEPFMPPSVVLPNEVFGGSRSRPFEMPAPSRTSWKPLLTGAGIGAAAALALGAWYFSEDADVSASDEPSVEGASSEAVRETPKGPVYNDVVNAFQGHAQKDLMVAAVTNALVDGLEEPVAGTWLETKDALHRFEKKLTTWGGYEQELRAGKACMPDSISTFFKCIEDSSLPNADWRVAHLKKEVGAIQDARIVPDQAAVAARHEFMREHLPSVKGDFEAQPPVAPRKMDRATTREKLPAAGSFGSLYEVPEAGNVRPVMQPVMAPRLASSHDVPEPRHVRPAVTAEKPTALDATDLVEPLHVRAPFSAEELAFFKQGETKRETAVKSEQPVVKSTAPASWKERVESGVSTVKNVLGGLGSRLGKWFR